MEAAVGVRVEESKEENRGMALISHYIDPNDAVF